MKKTKLNVLEKSAIQQTSLKIAQQQLRTYQEVFKNLQRQLKKERKIGVPNEATVREAIEAAKADWDQSKMKVTNAKAQSKKRKREIDEWKNWYHNLAEIDKSLQLQKLQAEIKWRAAEIANVESYIAGLYEERLEIEQRLEHSKQQLKAIEAGIHNLPLKEDPRLISVQEEINRLNAAVKVIQA